MEHRPTERAERCAAHDGAHPVWLGNCVALGAQVPRPTAWRGRPVICRECGAELDVLRLPGGRTVLLAAGTNDRHWHPEPRRIELDEERLAAAIVAASRAARSERQADSRATPPPAPARPVPPMPPPDPAPAPTPREDIPTVAVWSPERDDGSSL